VTKIRERKIIVSILEIVKRKILIKRGKRMVILVMRKKERRRIIICSRKRVVIAQGDRRLRIVKKEIVDREKELE
jgi:hypothetical protein